MTFFAEGETTCEDAFYPEDDFCTVLDDMCLLRPDFMTRNCRKTCGYC